MPNSNEMFYLDADGKKQDADLWAGLLGEEEGADLRRASAAMAKLRAEKGASRRSKARRQPSPAPDAREGHPEKA